MSKEWELLSQTPAYEGFRRVWREIWKLPNGHDHAFDILRSGDIVLSLALNTEGRVIVVKQFRPGPRRFLLDMPGGFVDEGEDPMQAATRELLEETGYAPDKSYYLGSTVAGAYSNYHRHAVLFTGCTKKAEPEPEESESIEVITMSLEEYAEVVRAGETSCTPEAFRGYLALGKSDLIATPIQET